MARYDIYEHIKAAEQGGYITIPQGGYPGHPEWGAGTRQWIPPGSPKPGQEYADALGATGQTGDRTARQRIPPKEGTSGTAGTGSNINYDAIRERAIAPSRAMYQNAMRNLNKQKGLGISSPGYGAQMLALNRGMNQAMSDAAIGAEASVSDTMLKEKGLAQDYALRSRGLDIAEKSAPSDLSRSLSTIGQVAGIASMGAGVYDTIWGDDSSGGGGNTRPPSQYGNVGGGFYPLYGIGGAPQIGSQGASGSIPYQGGRSY